ncbi:MAG: prenyltransferase/squalene oxidase repeat-containing protein [Planctomycetota bacterium]|jgi:squalene-hopene/tetraprenyl-beta-curcumene cyclase
MVRNVIARAAVACAAAALLFVPSCSKRPGGEGGAPVRAGRGGTASAELVERIDSSLARAAGYLVAAQSEDGLWRSETYGMFRDGVTLTPYVMSTLFFLRQGGPDARAAFRRGVAALGGMVDEDARVEPGRHGLLFPVLTATMASRVVALETKDDEHLRARDAFLAVARERQLTEALGWSPDDPAYGGWGFSLLPPEKPAPGRLRERFFESNMVATVFGIAALRSARVPLSDPSWGKALVFVKRCQNFAEDPGGADARFDDGGFFFIPEDELQNKAGVAGTDSRGRRRFRSYGTMTADGLRALLQCGLGRDHPRVAAARRWLEDNFSASENPGAFDADREVLRNATYYYWAWAAAHAFSRVGVRELRRDDGPVPWARELAAELVQRQRPDGSWSNTFTDAREDDQLVATPWAAAALAICRHQVETATDAPAPACSGSGAGDEHPSGPR